MISWRVHLVWSAQTSHAGCYKFSSRGVCCQNISDIGTGTRGPVGHLSGRCTLTHLTISPQKLPLRYYIGLIVGRTAHLANPYWGRTERSGTPIYFHCPKLVRMIPPFRRGEIRHLIGCLRYVVGKVIVIIIVQYLSAAPSNTIIAPSGTFFLQVGRQLKNNLQGKITIGRNDVEFFYHIFI